MSNWFDEKVKDLSLKDLKKEKNRWERKRCSAQGRGEFLGIMIIDSKLESLERAIKNKLTPQP